MRDYDELVNLLKICQDYCNGCTNCPHKHDLGCRTTMMGEAADAIEELAGFIQEAERDRDEYRERLDKADDAIEELVSNADKFKWISVEERLPNVDKTKSGYESVVVIAKIKGYARSKALIYERACPRGKIVYRWKWMWDTIYDGPPVTHWMPLPETQKEDDR